MRTVSSIIEKKKSMATFLANKINSTEGDITGRSVHVEIMFLLKGKKCRVFDDIQRKSNSVWYNSPD